MNDWVTLPHKSEWLVTITPSPEKEVYALGFCRKCGESWLFELEYYKKFKEHKVKCTCGSTKFTLCRPVPKHPGVDTRCETCKRRFKCGTEDVNLYNKNFTLKATITFEDKDVPLGTPR